MLVNTSPVEAEIDIDVSVAEFEADSFGALLEFVYTGHITIVAAQVLMPMAHRFGLKRVVTLCELAISKELDRACQQGIARSTLNPMVLLKLARDCDAEQLATFLRHFIGTNIEALQGKPEFRLINPDDLEQIEAHRWPPLWYLEAVRNYEQSRKPANAEQHARSLFRNFVARVTGS